jgi:predicted ArsR family transcriptional regulator
MLNILEPARARAKDPQTSYDAAASMKRAATAQAAKVLHTLRVHGQMGAEQIAELSGLDKFQVCRRLPELQAAGVVDVVEGLTHKTRSGRSERVWMAT